MSTPPEEWTWPVFNEPELMARMGMDQDSFFDLWISMASQMPPREFSAEAFTTGTAYPWPRPDGSFVLTEGEGRLLSDLAPEQRALLLEQFTGPGSGRTPMLAIGSNASPEGLWRKFAHLEEAEDRTLLAVSGHLHDFDVGASAELALYGAMPATIFPSPGTRVAATAVWLTERQLTLLAWAEVPYWLGRLDAPFEAERPLVELGFSGFDSNLVFVNRFGVFAPSGKPLALAAVPAFGRTAEALDQVELLTKLAELIYSPGLSAETLFRRIFEDPAEVAPRAVGALRSNSIPFESNRWTPFPA